MNLLDNQLIRFFLVSALNTLSFILVLVFLKYSGISDVVANLMGYLVVNIQGYTLNKIWTFENKEKVKKTFSFYLFVVTLAYVMNLLVLLLALDYFHLNNYVSHGIAVLVYGGVAFLGMRYFVFKKI